MNFLQECFNTDRLVHINLLGLLAVLEKVFCVFLSEIERFCTHHIFEVRDQKLFLLGGIYIFLELSVRISLSFHAIGQELFYLCQHLFIWFISFLLFFVTFALFFFLFFHFLSLLCNLFLGWRFRLEFIVITPLELTLF